jgi:hypothetical protein
LIILEVPQFYNEIMYTTTEIPPTDSSEEGREAHLYQKVKNYLGI